MDEDERDLLEEMEGVAMEEMDDAQDGDEDDETMEEVPRPRGARALEGWKKGGLSTLKRRLDCAVSRLCNFGYPFWDASGVVPGCLDDDVPEDEEDETLQPTQMRKAIICVF